jgi:excisionase family DNA binding protein
LLKTQDFWGGRAQRIETVSPRRTAFECGKVNTMDNRNEQSALRFVGMGEVCRRLSLSRWTINRMISDGQFPRPVRPAAGSKSLFSEPEVDAWMRARLAEREAA